MEKKPLFHFLPGKQILSIGTLGCNFACEFCQNWDISQASKALKLALIKNNKLNLLGTEIEKYGRGASPEMLVNYALKNSIPAIAYTYNEPSIFVEFAYDTAKLAHKHGLGNVYVSNGYESRESLEYMKPYLDAVNVDLKSYREDFYQKVCKARLKPVLENIKRIWEMGIWEEVTTLVIPGENDSDKELMDIATFIASVSRDIPWHVTRFHPDYKMREKNATPEDSLVRAYDIGKEAGLKYVYVGNILNNQYESTYCPKCREKLIWRNGYEVNILNLKNGACGKCGEKIAGRWK
jgi:pyruvate formate lyase activating enzyme